MKKICSQCKKELPANTVYFHRESRKTSGLHSTCKKCRLKKSKETASTPQFKKRKAEYRKKNRDHIREYKRNWERNRAETHPEFRIKNALRGRVREALKNIKKVDRTINLIGCSLEYFIAYLENKFQEGMNINNYGKWHIDHIRPCSSYDLTDPKQQRECFNYKNLQPLWAKDNLQKSDKYEF